MSDVKILLTGANGFLGSHLLEALLKENYSVTILKRSTSDMWRIEHLKGSYKSYDIDLQPIEQAFIEHPIDCVLHTACHYGRNDDSITSIVDSNLMYGLEILELAIAHKTRTFINTASFLPSQINTYSLSKQQFLAYLKKLSINIQVINMKLEHMYGPKDDNMKLMGWLTSQFQEGKQDINLTSGIQKRDFIYVNDVVTSFLVIIKHLDYLESYNEFEVGTGESIQVREFIKKIKQVYESLHGKIKTKLNFGVIPYRKGEVMEFKVNNDSLRRLGWNALIDLENGIELSLKG